MKLENIKAIRICKILQLVLYFIGMYYLAIKKLKLAVFFLLISFLIELILPGKYGWGLVKNRQNLFFKNNSWIEPVVFFFHYSGCYRINHLFVLLIKYGSFMLIYLKKVGI
ncbi:hypothetical protein [Candidatus Enterococcus mansonii]|uniref:Uncharacterized protein n=2 Tax=Candidatus Enterococcus mansonii TaxID=1834181 RepID=A0ABU8IBV2_9ENTE